MQKRVVYNFNAQTVAQTAAIHANGKAVKASNAIGKIKRAFSGKSLKLAVFVVLLFASLFCTIGSADWIISQQKTVPNGKDDSPTEKTFTIDEIGFDNYIDIPDITFNGKPAGVNTQTTANDGARELPKEAVDVKSGNVKFKVKPYKNETSAQSRLLRAPQKAASSENNAPAADAATNLPDENYFESGYTEELPTDAGTYAVLITSTVKDASSGKTISYGKAIKVFTIAPCPVTIEWSGAVDFVYDGTAHTLTPTAQNVVNNDNLGLTVTITGEKITGSSAINAGTYTATASIANKNYVIDENSKSATFTITARALTITANDHEITYGSAPATNGYKISGLVNNEAPVSPNISGTVKLTTNYTQFKDVGKYDIIVDISGLSSPNYSFKAVNGKLTVNKKELTVTAKNHEITYGEKPSANGYEIRGFVNNDNESVINGLENLTYIIDYAQWKDIGQFSITPKVDGLSAVNYSFKANSDGTLKVKSLNIQLSGIIERDYESGGIPYNKDLFSEATFTAPENPAIDLSQLKNIYQAISKAGNAQNFDNANGLDITAENGLFSYKFGEAIKAGSTYKIDSVTLNNKNLKLTKTEVYLKYKTAKIDGKCYTIEDALAQSGTITLCGNATSDSSYVITAFAKLNNLSGTAFGNYNTSYEYTLKSNSTLLLPYNKDGLATNADSDIINCKDEPEYVYTVLAISQGIKFTISGTLDIGGRLSSKGGDFNQARVKQHSVIYNNGNIVVTNRINSYGYLKGANDGLVELQSTATALDIMRVYDWLAGTEAIQIHNAGIFPFKSYSIHNISCKTKIIKGAQYLAKAALNVQNTLLPSNPIPIVGASGSMFTVESGYIVKTASNADSNKASTDLTSITGTNQLKGQKDIITLGDNTVCHDNSITLTIKMAGFTKEITTSKDYPLPISYFNLVVPNTATLNLNAVSYIFYPGSSLKVETGGKLVVEKVSVAFYTLNDCITDENWEKNRVKYATAEGTNDYAVDRTDAKLAIDAGGSATIKSNASISGCITATNAQAQLIINASTSVTVKVPTDLIANNVASDIDKGLIAAGITKASKTTKTYTAFGDIMTSQTSYARQDFSTGTYYSAKIGSAYAWFKNSATITYDPNGGTLNGNTTQNVTLPSGGYTNLPTPTRKYYSFDGWYFDAAFTQKATAIYTDCTLYAKWTPIHYTIQYILPYTECGALANGSLSGNQEKELLSPPNKTIIVDGTTYVFLGWYLNSEYSGNSVASVSAVNADDSGIINVYAYYSGNSYTVTYEENPDNITFANNKTVIKPEAQNFSQGDEIPLASLRSLSSYNSDKDFDYYFAGWYLSTDSTETPISSLSNIIDGDITLCAKWIKKAQLKIEMPVFENGNRTGNTIVYDTHKYFYKQTTDEIGINNLSSYIGAVYTVPEGYKFIGFNASSGFTAKQNYSNMNDITTAIEVGETSNDLTITADIRKILTVTLEMDAESEEYLWQTVYFSIDNISIESNSIYSTDKSNWLFSDGTGNITPEKRENKELQKVVFYILEGNTFTVTINNVKIISRKYSVPEPATSIAYSKTTTNESCLFTFATVEGDTTVKWTGKGTRV